MSRPLSARVDPRHLRDLRSIQCFVVTREQLLALGFTRHEITANVAARRWQTLGRTVVVLHNAALTAEQRRWAAVLLLTQPAALAGATAAELAGLRGFEDPDVHLVVDRSCSAHLPPWVRLHNSRRFSAADIASAGDPPRTSVERALIDAAAWSRRSRRACAILCAGVQQRLTTAHALTDELASAGPSDIARSFVRCSATSPPVVTR